MNSLQPVLLVEDSPLDAELTLGSLAELKLANELVWLRDGAEALDFLERRGPHEGRTTPDPLVVLLDLKMPRVDGLEVLRHVKSDPTLRGVPVVMLTSSSEERDLVESYRLGANAYVVKPVEAEKFTHAVRELGIFWALINQPPSREGP